MWKFIKYCLWGPEKEIPPVKRRIRQAPPKPARRTGRGKYLTIPEVARMLALQEWRVRELSDRGYIPSIRNHPNGPRLFRREDVREYIASKKNTKF